MRNAIDQLLTEHRVLMARFEELRRAVEDLRRRGDAALPDVLPALEAAGRMMTTDLHAHARKEDEALFPALESIFGAQGTPTQVMRQEHRDIHDRASLFEETLRELNEVEHPTLAAGGEMLRGLAARGGSAKALRVTGETILELVDSHFGKEEQILFPMARELLSPDALDSISGEMEHIAAPLTA